VTKSSHQIALYPGSFDLLTNGHLDLIRRGQRLFDRLIVAVGANVAKKAFFSVDERLEILRETTAQWSNVEVRRFDGLTVRFAEQVGARFIIRGLRAVSDFEFELQIALMNHRLSSGIETIFLAAETEHIFLSSRMIKDVWTHGGDISEFVPAPVLRALQQRADRAVDIDQSRFGSGA
jgi:pantetheine-phosphate adenylyltransferase